MSESGKTRAGGSAPQPVRRLGIEVQGKVDDYLLKVDGALTRVGASAAERRTVGVALRKQIMEKLSARAVAGVPTTADVESTLAELGPPESHLKDAWDEGASREAAGGGAAPAQAPGGRIESKLSITALIGAIWAFMFPIMLLLSMIQIEVAPGQGPPFWQRALQLIFVPLGWAAPFATTVLGLLALGQIQKSERKQRGLSLALFDAMVFPMLAVDFVVFWICWRITGSLQEQEAITRPIARLINQALPTIAVVLGNYYLVIKAWAAVQPKVSRRR